ncbi:MAG: class II glutamine amidotransferase [Thermoplasmata archaeon]
MCRLFGSLGSADFRPYDLLVDADRSLLRQANHSPEEAQNDGWGIAWYPDPDGTPRIEKGVLGAYTDEEREKYLAAAHLAKGPLVFGHLRHASNPLHLPPEALHGLVNSQPFVYENYLFAHNGMIPLPRETQALLGEFAAKVEGVNDSEVLFWLLVKNTEITGDPAIAYRQTIDDLIRVWEQNGRPGKFPYSGLNVLFSRAPDELWAFCHWNGEHGTGFFSEQDPYYQMTFQRRGSEIIMGSEPFDGSSGSWHPIPDGTFLHAQVDDGHLTLRTGSLPLSRPAPAT